MKTVWLTPIVTAAAVILGLAAFRLRSEPVFPVEAMAIVAPAALIVSASGVRRFARWVPSLIVGLVLLAFIQGAAIPGWPIRVGRSVQFERTGGFIVLSFLYMAVIGQYFTVTNWHQAFAVVGLSGKPTTLLFGGIAAVAIIRAQTDTAGVIARLRNPGLLGPIKRFSAFVSAAVPVFYASLIKLEAALTELERRRVASHNGVLVGESLLFYVRALLFSALMLGGALRVYGN